MRIRHYADQAITRNDYNKITSTGHRRPNFKISSTRYEVVVEQNHVI